MQTHRVHLHLLFIGQQPAHLQPVVQTFDFQVVAQIAHAADKLHHRAPVGIGVQAQLLHFQTHLLDFGAQRQTIGAVRFTHLLQLGDLVLGQLEFLGHPLHGKIAIAVTAELLGGAVVFGISLAAPLLGLGDAHDQHRRERQNKKARKDDLALAEHDYFLRQFVVWYGIDRPRIRPLTHTPTLDVPENQRKKIAADQSVRSPESGSAAAARRLRAYPRLASRV